MQHSSTASLTPCTLLSVSGDYCLIGWLAGRKGRGLTMRRSTRAYNTAMLTVIASRCVLFRRFCVYGRVLGQHVDSILLRQYSSLSLLEDAFVFACNLLIAKIRPQPKDGKKVHGTLGRWFPRFRCWSQRHWILVSARPYKSATPEFLFTLYSTFS